MNKDLITKEQIWWSWWRFEVEFFTGDGGIVTVDDKGELEESFDNNVVMTKKDGELEGGIVTVDDEGELEESFD